MAYGRTSVTPQEAKDTWERLKYPSIRAVHRALIRSGRKVSRPTIQKWKRNGWTTKPSHRYPNEVDGATRALELAIQGLTKTPKTRRSDLPQPPLGETGADLMRASEEKHFRTHQHLCAVLQDHAGELIEKNSLGLASLLMALSRFYVAGVDARAIVAADSALAIGTEAGSMKLIPPPSSAAFDMSFLSDSVHAWKKGSE